MGIIHHFNSNRTNGVNIVCTWPRENRRFLNIKGTSIITKITAFDVIIIIFRFNKFTGTYWYYEKA